MQKLLSFFTVAVATLCTTTFLNATKPETHDASNTNTPGLMTVDPKSPEFYPEHPVLLVPGQIIAQTQAQNMLEWKGKKSAFYPCKAMLSLPSNADPLGKKRKNDAGLKDQYINFLRGQEAGHHPRFSPDLDDLNDFSSAKRTRSNVPISRRAAEKLNLEKTVVQIYSDTKFFQDILDNPEAYFSSPKDGQPPLLGAPRLEFLDLEMTNDQFKTLAQHLPQELEGLSLGCNELDITDQFVETLSALKNRCPRLTTITLDASMFKKILPRLHPRKGDLSSAGKALITHLSTLGIRLDNGLNL